jgi:ubiquinone/menaquinone biosynthesis C-methylase UbiE
MVDYEGNVERFSGFAESYERYRFSPPEILADVLCRYAAVERPALVVDLGCGTGLSTRFWADRAERVIGIEPADDMLAAAAAATKDGNVEYRKGFGHETGLPDACADLVTCSQSFHWMEPQRSLTEVGRLLRPGGVFAAYDYHGSTVTGIVELEEAAATAETVYRLEKERGLKKALEFHGKDTHDRSLAECGLFRMTRRFFLHDVKPTSADDTVGGFETLGALQTLRKHGVTDEELGIAELRRVAEKHLGDGETPQVVSYEVHVGVMPG